MYHSHTSSAVFNLQNKEEWVWMTFMVTGKDVFFLALIVNTDCFLFKEKLKGMREQQEDVTRGLEVPGGVETTIICRCMQSKQCL